MNIEGMYTFQAVPEDVWKSLLDLQTIQSAVPGMEHLEAVDRSTYIFRMNIQQDPLHGTYQGQIQVLEHERPHTYRLAFQASGQQDTITGEWTVNLRGQDLITILTYKGSIKQGKSGSQIQGTHVPRTPLVKGTIKLLMQQFFMALADQLRSNAYSTEEGAPVFEDEGIHTEYSPETAPQLHDDQSYRGQETLTSSSKRAFLHTVVQKLGMGDGDPLEEERWVQRIRRFGIASVLLLLVWVGTRLPGKILD